jgi:two-component system heavy metal sensor histidine kinase CusS
LTATLALVFAATTLAVFALVGAYVYLALAHEVRTQDDLDIVLAARHTRRLIEELSGTGDLRAHKERIESQVLGNEALSVEILDSANRVLLEHNRVQTADRLPWPLKQSARRGRSPRRRSWNARQPTTCRSGASPHCPGWAMNRT